MTKSEAISWYRIQEMFRFDSFHMYGIIGSALITGILFIQIIKLFNLKDISGKKIEVKEKSFSISRYLFGGILFGFGCNFQPLTGTPSDVQKVHPKF